MFARFSGAKGELFIAAARAMHLLRAGMWEAERRAGGVAERILQKRMADTVAQQPVEKTHSDCGNSERACPASPKVRLARFVRRLQVAALS